MQRIGTICQPEERRCKRNVNEDRWAGGSVSAGVMHVSEDTSTSSDEEAVEANQGTMAFYCGNPQKVGELLKILEVAKSYQEVHGRK